MDSASRGRAYIRSSGAIVVEKKLPVVVFG